MVTYECKLCNYISNNKNNYERHNKTKVHKSKVVISTNYNCAKNIINSCEIPKHPKTSQSTEKSLKITCEYCNLCFTRTSSLMKHKKIPWYCARTDQGAR